MKVLYTNRFVKAIDRIHDKRLLADISYAIAQVKSAEDIRQIPKLKKMSGHKTAFRIKMGFYRIGVFIEGGTVEFAALAHRKDIYKRFP